MKRSALLLLALAVGCSGQDETVDLGRAEHASLHNVSWVGVVNATRNRNDLTKTGSSNDWDAGAVSSQRLGSDGYLEFTTAENTAAKMAGLSYQNDGESFEDIDFAIHLRADGAVRVREAGVGRGGDLGTYAAGDLFRVQVVAGAVTYWKNGVLLYASTAAPTSPLRVDCSLRTPGATILDAVVEAAPFWRAAVGTRADGSDLVKEDDAGLWNAGASSIASLTGDGYAELTTGEATTAKMVGLSNGDAGQAYQDIDFAIFLKANGTVAVQEGGQARGTFGPYAAGDRFRIAVSGEVVTYAQNGSVFYTSSGTPSFPLLLDASLRTPGATVTGAELVSTGGIATFDNTDGEFVWEESVDCVVSTGGRSLDITRAAAEQTAPVDHRLVFFKVCPQDNYTPGGFWFRGGSTPVGDPTPTVLAAGEEFIIDGDSPISPLPPLVKNPGNVVGRADVWSPEVNRIDNAGVQTAHFRDESNETGPSQVWFMSGIVGVRINLPDGPHYGFVELAWVANSGGFSSDYAPLRWGYNPSPGVGLVIPP